MNGECHLEKCILSIIKQSYKNIEYLIIDGNSTDKTNEILLKYDDYIDFWISEKDGGIYDAMNKGFTLSRGNYIGFVNCDDFLYPETIKILAEASLIQKFDYSIGPVDIYSNSGVYIETVSVLKNFSYHKKFLYEMASPHQAFYISKTMLKQVGYFDLNFRLRADFDLLVRTMLMSNNYYRFEASVGGFRLGGVSGSYDTYYENFKLMKKNGGYFPKILCITLLSMLKAFISKNFPQRAVSLLRIIFSSGRYKRK